jgi:hypothetical protein
MQAVLKEVDERLRSKPNIVGTGIGYKNNDPEQGLAIVANAIKKQPKGFGRDAVGPLGRVAKSYDGFQTDLNPTGAFKIFNASPTERQREWNPAPGGVSIGEQNITAGTLGCLVRKNGQLYILSNNHILADSNAAPIGSPILQPGRHDGGTKQIANLTEFVRINFEGEESNCEFSNMIARSWNAIARRAGSQSMMSFYRSQGLTNLIDAAIARPLSDDLVTSEILDIGEIKGWAEGVLGMEIQKSGRTTALTNGVIQQIGVTANVQYNPGQMALFTDQLLAGPISSGGDSGSAVLDMSNNLIGLLFAGSPETTLINRIENVFDGLNVTLN